MEWIVVTLASGLAGFVDSIVGGGGLVLVPALFATFPAAHPATLFGTNKGASVWGTAAATWQYANRVNLRWRALLPAVAVCFAGSLAGAPYRSGGKTGTAQAVTIGQKDRYDARRLEEHQRDHSLYLAFAPMENPQVALAVVVENAGFGAAHAAPIARRVFDYLLLGQYPSEEDMAAVSKGLATAPIGKPRLASDISLGPQP